MFPLGLISFCSLVPGECAQSGGLEAEAEAGEVSTGHYSGVVLLLRCDFCCAVLVLIIGGLKFLVCV